MAKSSKLWQLRSSLEIVKLTIDDYYYVLSESKKREVD